MLVRHVPNEERDQRVVLALRSGHATAHSSSQLFVIEPYHPPFLIALTISSYAETAFFDFMASARFARALKAKIRIADHGAGGLTREAHSVSFLQEA